MRLLSNKCIMNRYRPYTGNRKGVFANVHLNLVCRFCRGGCGKSHSLQMVGRKQKKVASLEV